MKIECNRPEVVAKRMFFLAWQACGAPSGMGVFQDNPGADEDRVWQNVRTAGDYPKLPNAKKRDGEAYGDYVFGRMMKLGIRWDEDSITISDTEPRPDYQSWCRGYPTHKALLDAAIESLGPE